MNPTQPIIGIDVGGANLKLATWRDRSSPECIAHRFPLWQRPQELGSVCQDLVQRLGPAAQLALTMTGELADCYATRRQGVQQILAQLGRVIAPERMSVYGVDGRWLTPAEAIADPWQVAASNWHALASWLGRWPATAGLCQQAVLVDIGSTTVDIIPLSSGQVATSARTDRQRLQQGQLVYTGISRTPVCAIAPHLKLNNIDVPLMAELFATSDDAYLVLGLVAEDADDGATADGRPRTAEFAAARLARMVGEDSESLQRDQIIALAEQIARLQAQQVGRAIERNLTQLDSRSHSQNNVAARSNSPGLIFTGHGEPLFERALHHVSAKYELSALPAYLSQQALRCAPAAAVAWLLAADQCQ